MIPRRLLRLSRDKNLLHRAVPSFFSHRITRARCRLPAWFVLSHPDFRYSRRYTDDSESGDKPPLPRFPSSGVYPLATQEEEVGVESEDLEEREVEAEPDPEDLEETEAEESEPVSEDLEEREAETEPEPVSELEETDILDSDVDVEETETEIDDTVDESSVESEQPPKPEPIVDEPSPEPEPEVEDPPDSGSQQSDPDSDEPFPPPRRGRFFFVTLGCVVVFAYFYRNRLLRLVMSSRKSREQDEQGEPEVPEPSRDDIAKQLLRELNIGRETAYRLAGAEFDENHAKYIERMKHVQVLFEEYSELKEALQNSNQNLEKAYFEYVGALKEARSEFKEDSVGFRMKRDSLKVEYDAIEAAHFERMHRFEFLKDQFYEEASKFLHDATRELAANVRSYRNALQDVLADQDAKTKRVAGTFETNRKVDGSFFENLRNRWKRNERELRRMESDDWIFDFKTLAMDYWYVWAIALTLAVGLLIPTPYSPFQIDGIREVVGRDSRQERQ